MFIKENELILVELDSMNEVHRNEIEILNKLFLSLEEKNEENITKFFDELIEDMKFHFDSEEKKMKEYNFHALMKHKMAHIQAILDIRKIRTQWEKNKDIVELKDFFETAFKPWLIRHLEWMDSVTAKFLKEAWCK